MYVRVYVDMSVCIYIYGTCMDALMLCPCFLKGHVSRIYRSVFVFIDVCTYTRKYMYVYM